MSFRAKPSSGCGTIASPSPACWCIWSAAKACACATKTTRGRGGWWKRRARFPSYCSTKSTIWTEFWRSTGRSTGRVSARAKNMSGASVQPDESANGCAVEWDCIGAGGAGRGRAGDLCPDAGIRVGRRLPPGDGAVHQSGEAALSGFLLPADAAERLLERRLDARVRRYLALSACRGRSDDRAGGAVDGVLRVAPLPGAGLAAGGGGRRGVQLRTEHRGSRIRRHRAGLRAVPVPDSDRFSVHGGGRGSRGAVERRRGGLSGVRRGQLFAADRAGGAGAARLDVILQPRREPMGEAGSLRRGQHGGLRAAGVAVR